MDDTQRLRYARHLLLDEFGEASQERLLAARALVVGAGGLGSSALLYLASSGVGRITIADGDTVDLTNLQRQVVHRVGSIGENKARSAAATLAGLNPEVRVEVLPERLAPEQLLGLAREADVVLDCSDNFATRHAINEACVRAGVPLVSGAGIRFDGQVCVFDRRQPGAACYHCLFPEQASEPELRCAEAGVFAPLVGIVGAMQAAEALKLLADVGTPLCGQLLLWDGLRAEARKLRVPRDPDCPVCARRPPQAG